MRKIFIMFAISLCVSFATAQQGEVPPALLTDYGWIDKTTLTIFGHPTTMEYGQINWTRRTTPGEMTNVAYLSLSQALEGHGRYWKAMKMSSEEANRAADSMRNAAPGGYVYLYLERPIENRANLQYFFIIIRDKNDKTVYTKYLPYQAAGMADGVGTWWNYVVTEIPVEVEYPFYIYVNDKQSEHLSDFKFRIDAPVQSAAVEIMEETPAETH